jgi:hypothetical protein
MRIALLVALLVLVSAGDAAASVARLRIDRAPADDSAGMPAPYIYVGADQAATRIRAKVTLGTSEGLPAPSPPRCDFEVLQAFPDFYPLLEASVDELAGHWRTGESLRLGAVWVCPTSKIVVRVAKLGRRPGVVAKAAQELDFSATYGQIGPKLKLTAKGRALRRRGASFRAKVTIVVTDGAGATVTYSRKVRLRSS